MINFSQDTWVYKLEVGAAGLRCPGWNVYLCPRCLLQCMSLFLIGVIIVMDVSALTTASCAAFETVWKCHFIYLLMAQMMMQHLSAWTIKGEMASVDNWDKCEEKSRARMWTLGEPQRRICTRLLFSLMSNNLSPFSPSFSSCHILSLSLFLSPPSNYFFSHVQDLLGFMRLEHGTLGGRVLNTIQMNAATALFE